MRRIFLLLVPLFLLSPFYSRSQWNPCIGIEGGNISDIIYHDTSLYIIAVGSGVFKKGISEPTWSENMLHGVYQTIRSTDTVLFCIDYNALYRSMDHGETWDSQMWQPYIYDLETAGDVVFVVTEQSVLRSFDQGDTWTDVNPFPGNQNYNITMMANDNWLICDSYGIDTICYSDDFGGNWTCVPLTDSVWSISDAYMTDYGLWISYRIYNTWDRISFYDPGTGIWTALRDSIPPGTNVWRFFIWDDVLRCATAHGIFYFDPEDSLWISDNNQGLENKDVSSVCVIGDSAWAATRSGPFFNPGNSDWSADYHHLYQREIYQVFRYGNRLYAVSRDKIYYSDSIEAGFEVMNTPGLYDIYDVEPTDSVWLAGSSAGFLVSIDSGATWVPHTNGMEGRRAYEIASTSRYYFCTSIGLFRSGKDSISWERVPNEIGTSNVLHVRSLNDIVFASVDGGGLFRSADQGNSFQHVPESGNEPPRLHAEDQDFYMLKSYGPILTTSGECTQWHPFISEFIDYTLLIGMDIPDSGNSAIVGGGMIDLDLYDYFLEYYEDPSTEEGIDITDNLPYSYGPLIMAVHNDNGRLFASPSDNSLYYRDDFIVNVEEDPADEITGGDGVRIYPNPASGRITIELPAINDILYVKVFDSRGRQLFYREMTGPHLDLSGLKAGLYILEINTGDATTRKKIVMR